MDEFNIAMIIGAVVFVIVFLILREFWTWYWKQNEIINQLKKQNEKLDQIATLLGGVLTVKNKVDRNDL